MTSNLSVRLRLADIKDARFIWELRNNKNIRKKSFDSTPISFKQHLKWFSERLSTPNTFIFIVVIKRDIKIGYIRFEKEQDKIWKVSIAIIPRFQSRGYGWRAIKIGCQKLFKIRDAKKVVVYILKNNSTSFNAFKKAGFIFKKDIEINQKDTVILEKRKNLYQWII